MRRVLEIVGLEPSRWAMCNPMSNRDKIGNDRGKIDNDCETRLNDK